MPTPVFLILEPMALIAADLAMSVQESEPQSVVVIASMADQAMDLLQNHSALCAAFLHTDPAKFDFSPLGRLLLARRARCIFMGDRAERNGSDIWVLERPFSTENVHTIMRRLVAPNPGYTDNVSVEAKNIAWPTADRN